MKLFRISLMIVVSVLLFLLFSFLVLTLMHESFEGYDDKFAKPEPADAHGVSVRFMGNTNLLFSDGDTNILIDGWFSRPSLLSLAVGRIEPDLTAITDAFEKGKIGKLAAVIPVHSHYDHAMDSPEVARRTGAQLLGSESTANIARGWGLSENQIDVVQLNESYQYGDFSVTLIPSEHFEFPNANLREAALGDIQITQPLVPPAKVTDYKMGGAFTVYIKHPRGNVLVQGSAGFTPNALDSLSADVVFLGVGGINLQTDKYRKAYWKHIVEATNPSKIYPVHWDSLTDSLGDKPVTQNLLFSSFLKVSSTSSLSYTFANADKDNIDIALLPMWKPINLF